MTQKEDILNLSYHFWSYLNSDDHLSMQLHFFALNFFKAWKNAKINAIYQQDVNP